MPSQTKTLTLSYNVDFSLLWSAEEYVVFYLTDIPLRGLGGELMTNDVIEDKIKIATVQMEHYLNLKIPIQRISEYQDFDRPMFNQWGALKCNYLITEVKNMWGQLNYAKQIKYPDNWISINKSLDKMRNIHIIPSQAQAITNGVEIDYVAIFTGTFPMFGYASSDNIPNYWALDYISGWMLVPRDLLNAIAKYATMQILAILGDVAFGAGIASESLSLDGLSQSIGTTQSAENSLYSARIRQFEKELKYELKWLNTKYNGNPNFFSM
jgi:hypothetical protein